MAERRPLVIVGGEVTELPSGDTLPGSGGGGGGLTWTTVTANTTMTAGSAYIAVGALDMTLPASTAAGDYFIVHAQSATVRVVSNGNVITGVGSGNDLTLAAGETAWLVARSAGNLEIV
jgi:hypothetical protein